MPLVCIDVRALCELAGLMCVIVILIMLTMPQLLPARLQGMTTATSSVSAKLRKAMGMSNVTEPYLDYQPGNMEVAPSHFKSGAQTAGQAALETRLYQDLREESEFVGNGAITELHDIHAADAYVIEDGEAEMNTMARGHVEGANYIAPSVKEVVDNFEDRFNQMRRN